MKDSEIAIQVELYRKAIQNAVLYQMYIYRAQRDIPLSEDITQDAIIKIVLALRGNKFREDTATIKTWMIRIGVNTLKTYYRDNNVITKPFDNDIHALYFDSDTLDLERIKQAREQTRSLSFDQREVVILKIFFKCSFKEIAERTNSKLNTALGRMRKAMINLRKRMDLVDDKNYRELERLDRLDNNRKIGAIKLNKIQIKEIRHLLELGTPRQEIADIYNTSTSNLDFIRNRDTFKKAV